MIKPTRSAFYRRLYGVITRNRAPAPAPAATRPVRSLATGSVRNLSKKKKDSVRKDISEEEQRRQHLDSLRLKEYFTKEEIQFRARWGMKGETFRRMTQAERQHWMEQIVEDLRKYGDISGHIYGIKLRKKEADLGNFEELFEGAEKVFRYLLRYPSGSPDYVNVTSVTDRYNKVMKGYCEMGFFNSAVKMLDEMETEGLVPDLSTYNTLLDGLYCKGKLEDGDRIWERMVGKEVSPDVTSYISKLIGFASTKRTKEGVELLEEMRTKGIKPDPECYRVLMKGFINERNLEEMKRVYGEMREAGFSFVDVRSSDLIYFAEVKAGRDFVTELRRFNVCCRQQEELAGNGVAERR